MVPEPSANGATPRLDRPRGTQGLCLGGPFRYRCKGDAGT